MNDDRLIPAHGGYRRLKSFQIAQLVYDVTVRFCDRYIDRRSRTRDQMVQAARSGVQNIAEGSQASGTSKKFELKLTNVARASLEELRLDYEDFLRQRGLVLWPAEHPALTRFKAKRCTTLSEVKAWAEAERRGPRTTTDEHGRTPTNPVAPKSVSVLFTAHRQCGAVASESRLLPAGSPIGGAGRGIRKGGWLHRAPASRPLAGSHPTAERPAMKRIHRHRGTL